MLYGLPGSLVVQVRTKISRPSHREDGSGKSSPCGAHAKLRSEAGYLRRSSSSRCPVRYSETLGLRNGSRRNSEMTRTHRNLRHVEKPWSPSTWNEQAPLIQPAAVEMHVEGRIGGIRVQGWIDLIDVDGQIIDIKTAARRPSGVDVDHRFQIATYTQLAPGASGQRACRHSRKNQNSWPSYRKALR